MTDYNEVAKQGASALALKGYKRPQVTFRFDSDENCGRVSVEYMDSLDERHSNWLGEYTVIEQHSGDVVAAMWSVIAALSSAEEAAQAHLAAATAKLLQKARDAQINETFVGELAALVERLSKNILTDQSPESAE